VARPVVHIVGGGIGGLALAVALGRRGWPFEVYEGAPSYAAVGGGHWLYANALDALDRIDPAITADLVALGMPFEGFWFETVSGRQLLREPTTHYTPRQEHAPVVLKRWDIIDRLAARVPPDRLHFGRRLERVEGDTLVFTDGERVRAEIVVAADGIHSVVRRDLIGGHGPRFSGQTGLWGIGPGTLPGDAARHFTELWGDGVRMGFTAVTGGSVYWFLVVRDAALPADAEARKALVLERAAPFPAALVEAARGTPADRIHVNPLWDLSPLRRWWAHGASTWAVGIGDAVHATTPNLGQGGCQALEDAVALSLALETHTDPSEAFAAYQAARWRRASAVTLLARWLGDMAQMRGPLRHLRDLLVGATPAVLVRPVLRWVMTPPR
jgi:2-polyprenyl-6-methoxyphenol hydroxylase-like FAD-dependent oxidoreductase